jgi:glyoxylase-like metal-dependent hydrolase (beta-lactamase superfamily II)
MIKQRVKATGSLLTILALCAPLGKLDAATNAFKVPPAWTRATTPFHVLGPVWYVGSEGLASYLIKTRSGAILVDGTMAENVPGILRNIAAIGVRPREVRILLVTHAHFDHVAGDAAVVRATGARVVAGKRDVAALENGTPPGEVNYRAVEFSPVHVTRGVSDGDTVSLGGVTLQAVATPGHTPGCTSWTMRVVDRGVPLNVVFACSLTTGGNILVGNRRYPGIVADFRSSFRRLAALPADVVLPAHPEIADVMVHKRDGRWVQPGLLKRIATLSAHDFNAELARQQQARK